MSQLIKKNEGDKKFRLQPIFSFPQNSFDKGLKSFSFFCLLLSLVMFIDYFLPRTVVNEAIIGKAFLHDGGTLILQFKTEDDKISIEMSNQNYFVYLRADSIMLERTAIFQTKTKSSVPQFNWTYIPYFSLYSSLLFIPIILSLLSLVSIRINLGMDTRYSVAVLQMMFLAGFVYMRLYY